MTGYHLVLLACLASTDHTCIGVGPNVPTFAAEADCRQVGQRATSGSKKIKGVPRLPEGWRYVGFGCVDEATFKELQTDNGEDGI